MILEDILRRKLYGDLEGAIRLIDLHLGREKRRRGADQLFRAD